MLMINEIYHSIQGESSFMGKPCVFVRLTYCNLRCSYCDTEYAFYEGNEMTIKDIIKTIKQYNCNLVEITGGEPLMQHESIQLMETLISLGYETMLETGGSLSVKEVPEEVIKIVDFKCPSSKMSKKNKWTILDELQSHDEVKFVIGNKADYNWVKKQIDLYKIDKKFQVLLSPVYDKINPEKIVDWMLKDKLKARFQIQLHKAIWGAEKQSV